MSEKRETLRVAAVADVHCGRGEPDSLRPLFARAAEEADVLLLAGDVTDHGRPAEGRALIEELKEAGELPVLAVLGNHDHEAGEHDELVRILTDGGIRLLDGEACEVEGVGFAGVKGFAGGFGSAVLEGWGEAVLKRFVDEAVEEALKLENALARLTTPARIALLHYAPIRETIEGEAVEIFPFLGTSRLEDALSRFPVSAVFHGHAHIGSFEGRTRDDVPVYNVSVKVLEKTFPDRIPIHVIEVPLDGSDVASPADRQSG